jgi:sigma-B regulation protein RsbU (phosphoserine phosphatase)
VPECLLSAKGGRSCLVDLRVEPYRDEKGKIKGIVMAFRNVSERSRIQSLIDRELESAADFHQSLLPPTNLSIGTYRAGSFLLAATYGAGDIYGFFAIDDRHLGMYIIDVMGHGITASSIALLLSRLLTPDPKKANRLAFLDTDPRSPRLVAEKLNDLFYGSGDQMFFTMCYCVLDKENGKLNLIRAGHPYPILQKADGALQEIRSGGYAVGLARNVETPEIEMKVSPGDRLIFYSDGLTECADSRSIHFSREKLVYLVGETRRQGVIEMVSRIKKEVIDWRGQESFDDDISMIAVQIGAG